MLVTTQWPLKRAATSPHLSGSVFYGCLESLTELSALCTAAHFIYRRSIFKGVRETCLHDKHVMIYWWLSSRDCAVCNGNTLDRSIINMQTRRNVYLIIVRTVRGFFDTGIFSLFPDLHAHNGIHIEAGQLTSFDNCQADLKSRQKSSWYSLCIIPALKI